MIIIGIGGNLGTEAELRARFAAAREAIAQLGRVRSASLYRTAPIGPAQGAFLNTAVALDAPDMQPDELMATLLEIERLLGRRREAEARWGSRTIDLDVLLWDARAFRTETLEVPHPRVGERRFALAPLVDLAGESAVIPGRGTAGALLAAVSAQDVEFVDERW